MISWQAGPQDPPLSFPLAPSKPRDPTDSGSPPLRGNDMVWTAQLGWHEHNLSWTAWVQLPRRRLLLGATDPIRGHGTAPAHLRGASAHTDQMN